MRLVLLCAIMGAPLVAHAAEASAAPVGDPMTIALVVSMIGLLSALVRRVAPAVHALQTPLGLALLSGLGGIAGAVAQTIQQHGFAWHAIAVAALGALTAALGAWNPSPSVQATKPAEVVPFRRAQGGYATVAALLVLLVLGALALLGAGCAASPYDKARQVVSGAEAARSVSAQALDAYDGQHLHEIVSDAKAKCASDPDPVCPARVGEPVLTAYLAQYAGARKALLAWQGADHVAADSIDAAEKIKAGPASLSTVVRALAVPVGDAAKALTALGIAPAILGPLTAALQGGI